MNITGKPAGKYPDKEWLAMILDERRCPDAIREIYRVLYALCLDYVTRNSGTSSDAEDIFQEVVLSFIEVVKKGRFRGESSISTFVYALIRHSWLNELKKRSSTRLREQRYEKGKVREDPDVSQIISGREERQLLMKLVEELGERCKTVLLAYYYENLPVKDILLRTDFDNEQVVRNKKYKCLKQLTELIKVQPGLATRLKAILSYE